MSLELYCLRHGETDWNIDKRIQGHYDTPLNAQGIKQAELVGKYLHQQDCKFSPILCSDLIRARLTAKIINQLLPNQTEIIASDIWRERNFGDFEGLTYSELNANYPLEFQAIEQRQADFAANNGETLNQLKERVEAGIYQISKTYAGHRVLLVSHGGVLDVINRLARGLALNTPRDFVINNCGLSHLVYNSKEEWQIKFWSLTDYLQVISQDEL